MAQQKRSIEEMFAQLETLTGKMEAEDISLEYAFACYEEGMRILKACNQEIAGVEQKVKQMTEDGSLTDYE